MTLLHAGRTGVYKFGYLDLTDIVGERINWVAAQTEDPLMKILLQRSDQAKFAQGMWDLPVGQSEPGEPENREPRKHSQVRWVDTDAIPGECVVAVRQKGSAAHSAAYSALIRCRCGRAFSPHTTYRSR
ncbi:hypothetical protein AB1046_13640 [Promicromonospora sp. Populi]|uniref:hypothetical protein n=1 Tax=Promicromonospora sp. Populi TaxID=3239420 RepID=UPI0034E19513